MLDKDYVTKTTRTYFSVATSFTFGVICTKHPINAQYLADACDSDFFM